MSFVTKPRISPDTDPYWEGCRQGELRYQRCTACGEVVFHPRGLCPYCLADALEWRRSSGRGRVYSCSVQHVAIRPDRPPEPRVLGIAALEEGFHMFSEFLAADPDAVRVDDGLEVVFEEVGDGVVLPKFRVAGR